MDKKSPVCAGCSKPPAECGYQEYAEEAEISANEYVRQNEGTYNRENGHFWCDRCYIKVGVPLGVAP